MIATGFDITATASRRSSTGPRFQRSFLRGALPAGVALLRGSTASYTTAGGALALADPNQPRFDHGPGGVARGLLVESAATNLLRRQAFVSSASAGLTRLSLTASGIFPAVSEFSCLPGSFAHYAFVELVDGASVVAGQTYALSFWLSTTSPFVFVSGGSTGFGTNQWLVVDAQSGAIVHARNCTGTAEPFGAGWRVTMVLAATGTATSTVAAGLSNGSDQRFPAFASTDTLVVHAAQVEQGATASSYIPTTGIPATRAADAPTLTGPVGVFDAAHNYGDGSRDTRLAQSITAGWWPVQGKPHLARLVLYAAGQLG